MRTGRYILRLRRQVSNGEQYSVIHLVTYSLSRGLRTWKEKNEGKREEKRRGESRSEGRHKIGEEVRGNVVRRSGSR